MSDWVPKSPAAVCGIGFGFTAAMSIDCLAGVWHWSHLVPLSVMVFFGVLMVLEIFRDQHEPTPPVEHEKEDVK